MAKKIVLVLILIFLPTLSFGLDRDIELLVFFNDLVPQICDPNKKAPFEFDRDVLHKKIHAKLVSKINESKFLSDVEDKALLVLVGYVHKPSYRKGVLRDELNYIVHLATASQNPNLTLKKVFATIPIKVEWSPPEPLNEILKPKIEEAVDKIIKDVILKK